jgi:hypothetical protein
MSVALKTFPGEKQQLCFSFFYYSFAINIIKQLSKEDSGLTESSRVKNIGKLLESYRIQEVKERTNAN